MHPAIVNLVLFVNRLCHRAVSNYVFHARPDHIALVKRVSVLVVELMSLGDSPVSKNNDVLQE